MCWLPAVCVSWGSFCLGSLSLTEDSNIIWGGDTVRIDYWLACQEVLLMRGMLVLELPLMPPFPESWQGVCRIFPSILSCCSILSSFVSVTLLSPHLTIRFPTISLLSKVFPPGFPILGQCIPDMVLQAFGFHPSGKGTHLITLDALYRHTPISRNFRVWCSWFGIVCPLVQICGLISYLHLQTQLDAVVPLLCLQCSLPVIWAASFILEAFIFKLHSSVFWVRGIASCVPQIHVLFAVLLSLSVSPDLTVANIKALILMALWLTGAHFPYYLRLFLLNLTVISVIDTHYNFQNCPLLGLWLCFFPFMSVNSSLLMLS